MRNILLIVLLLPFITGCTTKTSNIQTSQSTTGFSTSSGSSGGKYYGEKDKYDIDENRDIGIIKRTVREVYQTTKYILDSHKYGVEDYHSNHYKIVKLLSKGHKNKLNKLQMLTFLNDNNVSTFDLSTNDKGRIVAIQDCEDTANTIESLLVERGINPRRLYKVFCIVYSDKSMLERLGGHMVLMYISPSGKAIVLEQLPYFESAKKVITGLNAWWEDIDGIGERGYQNYYKFISRSRSDLGYSYGQKFDNNGLYKLVNDIPVVLDLKNERKGNNEI